VPEVELPGARIEYWRDYLGRRRLARRFGDTQQEHNVATVPRGRRVEHANDVEVGA
jgi:hypothetical protein